ncbi:MAG: hypothetical protein C0519_09635 [Hyphomicrobium sp.]|nr:hypothetical protein [Hyphomicrobium sp.]
MAFTGSFDYSEITMLVILKSGSSEAARSYFDQSLRIGDYYREGEQVLGRWHGIGAARLGLAGEVSRRDFCALIDNRDPRSGKQLTPRMKADRVPGFDFTFTAPKSVSVLYAMTRDERITDALRASVADAMREVERDMKTRVRVNPKGRLPTQSLDEDRVTGNMVWAEFLHHTARPIAGIPDPHLHIHAYAMNLTYDAVEKRWKAAQIGDIKGEANYYEAVYHAALAKRLVDLGYGIDRRGRFFEVAGLDRDLLDRFSQRRDVVEKAAVAEGSEDNPQAKRTLSRLTREKKSENLTIAELFDVWKARLFPKERVAVDRVIESARHGLVQAPSDDVRQIMGVELSDALRSESAVSEKMVLTRVLRRGFGALVAADAKVALEHREIIRGKVGGRSWITTMEAYGREQAVVSFARKGRNRCAALGAGGYEIQTAWLNDQQRAAIRHVWTSQDQLMMVRGGAGVGKTTLMGEAVAGITAGGHKCFVFASTVPATEVLRVDGFKGAQTVQKLIASMQLQSELGRGAVIWVDEAGLIDMETMHRLFQLAEHHRWRVILSGDEKQHSPVRRGDAMRLLRDRAHLPLAEVTEIVRQRGDYKQAVQSIQDGLIADGWKQLEAMGAIIEVSGVERIERLAADYVQSLEQGNSVLVVAPTNRERQAVTLQIREALKREGLLGKQEHDTQFLRNLYWGNEAKADLSRYRTGLVVRFRQHVPGVAAGTSLEIEGASDDGRLYGRLADGEIREVPLGHVDRFEVYAGERRQFAVGDRVRMVERCPTADGGELTKGSFHTIAGISEAGDVVLERGRVVPRAFPFMDHGYSSTSVSSQGLTVNTVLVAMGSESVPAMSREQFYVSVSRGKRRVRLYVDDVKEVREAVQHSSARSSAHDLVEGKIRKEDTRVQRLKEWRRRLTRTAERMVRERGAELDADVMREASLEVQVEYLGRMRDHAPELGE